jgi:hypothetical protein
VRVIEGSAKGRNYLRRGMFGIAFCANRPVLLRRPGVGEAVRTALRGRTDAEDGYPAFETYLCRALIRRDRRTALRVTFCATSTIRLNCAGTPS